MTVLSPTETIHELREEEDRLLPFKEVTACFGLFESGRAETACRPDVALDATISCSCCHCATWKTFLRSGPHYEVLTQEHVAGLASYFLQRAAALGLRDCLVLELGAGSGRLAHHLTVALDALSAAPPGAQAARDGGGPAARVRLAATDSDARGLRATSAAGGLVRVLPYGDALREYRPQIVLVAWQPLGCDWTAAIRGTESVAEYVLVGEADGGICGDPWLTWGFEGRGFGGGSGGDSDGGSDGGSSDCGAGCRGGGSGGKRRRREAPYERDGFERVDLEGLSRWQICRTDERWRAGQQSSTVSFRRLAHGAAAATATTGDGAAAGTGDDCTALADDDGGRAAA